MANSLKFVFISLTLALLAAIAICSLAPSPNMREMWWIPGWLGEWADRHGNLRNFPVFAAFAAVLLCAVTADAPLVSRYGRWRIAFGAFLATALLGISLESAQLFLPHRWADPMDIVWSSLGAFVGAAAAAAFLRSDHFDEPHDAVGRSDGRPAVPSQ